MTTPIHLHPTAPLAPRVLLPGDPGRALRLAQSLLHQPRMFNHNRGLWGYTGQAMADGEPLTIQSTGMGGPSAAIVVAELCDLGARTLLRVGTAGAIVDGPGLGEVVAACTDLFYDPREGIEASWAAAGAEVVEMETATVFALARTRGAQAGALLIVSDLLFPQRQRIEQEALHDAERRLGEHAVQALAGLSPASGRTAG
jgi:uridine phosphorylase